MPGYTDFSTLNDISDQLEVEWVRRAFENLMDLERDCGDARLAIAVSPAEVPPGYQISVVMDPDTGEGMSLEFSPKTHRLVAFRARFKVDYASAVMTKSDMQELIGRMRGFKKP